MKNKTPRELNTEHARKELLRVRPKHEIKFDGKELQAIVNNWIRASVKGSA